MGPHKMAADEPNLISCDVMYVLSIFFLTLCSKLYGTKTFIYFVEVKHPLRVREASFHKILKTVLPFEYSHSPIPFSLHHEAYIL